MQHGSMLRTRAHDMSIGGLMIRQGGVLPTSGCTFIGDLFMWPTVLEEGCFALTDTHSLAVEGGKEYPITNLALPESVGFSLMSLT